MMGNEYVLNPEVYFAAAVVLFGLTLLFIIILWLKLSRMKTRYKSLINGDSGMNVEELLIKLQSGMNEIRQKSEEYGKSVDRLADEVKNRKSRVGALRYNAFNQGGSDLSFSIAIVNDYRDGVVITGIHNREETHLYAKPLEKGESRHTLSQEEKRVIDLAFAAPEK